MPRLVGGLNPSEKYESQLGLPFPKVWENNPVMFQSPPTSKVSTLEAKPCLWVPKRNAFANVFGVRSSSLSSRSQSANKPGSSTPTAYCLYWLHMVVSYGINMDNHGRYIYQTNLTGGLNVSYMGLQMDSNIFQHVLNFHKYRSTYQPVCQGQLVGFHTSTAHHGGPGDAWGIVSAAPNLDCFMPGQSPEGSSLVHLRGPDVAFHSMVPPNHP